MGRKRRPEEPSSYQPAPAVPELAAERYQVITAVLAGTMSVSEGARRLRLARNNFQTLVHRAQAAMVESLLPRPTGPAPQPARERALETEVQQLTREKTKLAGQLETMDRLLGVASEVIHELRGRRPRPRSRRSSPSSTPSSTGGAEPEDPETAALLARVAPMCRPGARAARALGVGSSTLRRWRARRAAGLAPAQRRGLRRCVPTVTAAAAVRSLVRALNGLVGAAALAHEVAGVSRRAAAALKAAELQLMEQERRAACAHVTVLTPGVVRGFDAMRLKTTAEPEYALVAADAAVPYRTTIDPVPKYDGAHVAQVLEMDFSSHGPPLVCRLDRFSGHDAPEVIAVLARHQVLPLHGPPHLPRYYGQLERQNREHRAWLRRVGPLAPEQMAPACARMQGALNGLWPRRRLNWRTAASVWEARGPVTDDRVELHDDVTRRTAALQADGVQEDLAMRLAIEQALIARGHLQISAGRRVLRE
jgi:hypothetical protein